MATQVVPFENLKLVDQPTKDLVTGFIKITETKLENDCIIPSLVITTCILFYHLAEFFSICGKDMKLAKDSTLVQISSIDSQNKYEVARNTAYGNVIISNKYD